MSSSLKGYLLAQTSAFFLATGPVLVFLIQAPANQIAFYRSLIAGVVFFSVFLLFQGKIPLPRNRKELQTSALSGFLLAAHWYAFFSGVKEAGAAPGTIAYSTFPFFIAFLEPMLLKQKPDKIKICLSAFLMVGVALVFPEPDFGNQIFTGILWGIAGGFLFALLSLSYKFQSGDLPASNLLSGQMLFASIFLLPTVLPEFSPILLKDLPWLFILGGVSTLGAFGCYTQALKHIDSRSASMIIGLETVHVVWMSIWLFDEHFRLQTSIGVVIIVGISIAIGFYDRKKKKSAF